MTVVAVVLLYAITALVIVLVVKGWRRKLVAALVMLLIPTVDHLVGSIYYRYLCLKYSGLYVQKVVEIESELFLGEDEPDKSMWIYHLQELQRRSGVRIDRDKFRRRFEFSRGVREEYSALFRIFRRVKTITDLRTKQRLGSVVKFTYGGGWVENLYKVASSRSSCPAETVDLDSLAVKTFQIKTVQSSREL